MHLPVNAPHIRWICSVTLMALAGCGPMPVAKSDNHIATDEKSERKVAASTAQSIPAPVRQVALPPPPVPKVADLKYSVVVNDVSVKEVLFAIAKETKLNIDIHPGIEGKVTLNAIDQTVKQLLNRLSKQVDMRWEVDGPNISVMPDSPYLKIYQVNYVNLQRDMAAGVNVATQTSGGLLGSASASPGTIPTPPPNTSVFVIGNASKNRFWETLEKNIKDLLRETDKLLPEGSSETVVRRQGVSGQQTSTAGGRAGAGSTTGSASSGTGTSSTTTNSSPTASSETSLQTLTFREAASVIVNPETGVISIRATSRQHEKVAEFLAHVSGSAKRQVLIEATVVEVILNDAHQSGVDWSALALDGLGYSVRQNFTGANLSESPFFSLTYSNPSAAAGGSISSTIKLLSSFGNTRVLSSPKIMALNNQMSILKVVDNFVYFEVQANVQQNQTNSVTTFSSRQQTVPIGFVMYVTPQISESDTVLLNVRPVVSRLLGFVNDPNPDLARVNVRNPVPQVQTREMESVLSVSSGQTAILGGLMQDSIEYNRDGLPILSRIPVLGDAVSYRKDTNRKSELVIFLRPIVIRDASTDTDLVDYRKYLPDSKFFKDADLLVPELAPPFTMKPNPVVPDAKPPKP